MSMRVIEGEQILMRIFIGESDQWERRPLHTALVELFVLPDVDRMMGGSLITMERV